MSDEKKPKQTVEITQNTLKGKGAVIPRSPIKKKLPNQNTAESSKMNFKMPNPSKNDATDITKLKLKEIKKPNFTQKRNPLLSKSHVEADGNSITSSIPSAVSVIRGCMSARGSNATLRSDNLVIHRPGTIPSYLKKNDKITLRSQILTRKKQFNSQKKKLTESQNEILEAYKVLKELQEKFNKISGQDEKTNIEELKLITFDENTSNHQTNISPTNNLESASNLKLINFKGLQNKLEDQLTIIHETGFKLCQEFVDENCQILKTMNQVQAGDFQQYTARMQEFFKLMEERVLKAEKEQNQRNAIFLKDLNAMLVTSDGVQIINYQGIMDKLEDQLRLIHETGFKLCQEFVDFNYKVMDSMNEAQIGDFQQYPTRMQEFFNEMEQKIIKEEKAQLNRIDSFIKNLDTMLVNSEGEQINNSVLFTEEFKNYKETHEKQILTLTEKFKETQKKLINEEQKHKELKKTFINESTVIQNLKNHENELNAKIKEKEKEIEKIITKQKSLEQYIKKLESKLELKTHDLQLKDKTNLELKKEMDVSENKLDQYILQVEHLKKQIETLGKTTKQSIEQTKDILQKEREDKLKVENELKAAKALIAHLEEFKQKNATGNEVNVELTNRITHLTVEVEKLKNVMNKLQEEKKQIEREKASLLEQLTKNSTSEIELDMIKKSTEIERLKNVNNNLQIQIEKKDRLFNKKLALIQELEDKLYTGGSQNVNDTLIELQNEVTKLRATDSEKKMEIEKLHYEISKSKVELKQHEESIFMHQRLLHIRSELINSMQQKEELTRCRLTDLYSEIDKKSSLVNQMNHEIMAKSEELQNLFSTLGDKQLEVSRQEQLIKMLEDNNKRNHKIRVRQEERIGRLENENTELKQLLSSSFAMNNFNTLNKKSIFNDKKDTFIKYLTNANANSNKKYNYNACHGDDDCIPIKEEINCNIHNNINYKHNNDYDNLDEIVSMYRDSIQFERKHKRIIKVKKYYH